MELIKLFNQVLRNSRSSKVRIKKFFWRRMKKKLKNNKIQRECKMNFKDYSKGEQVILVFIHLLVEVGIKENG